VFDVDVALKLNVVPSSVVVLFLKECKFVAKYLKGEGDTRLFLSENEYDVVQTTRRLGRPRKSYKMSAKKK